MKSEIKRFRRIVIMINVMIIALAILINIDKDLLLGCLVIFNLAMYGVVVIAKGENNGKK